VNRLSKGREINEKMQTMFKAKNGSPYQRGVPPMLPNNEEEDCLVSVYFGIKLGTGRTYCRFCHQPLQKGQPAIYISGYNASGQDHALPEHCPYLTKRLLEMEVIE